MHLDVASLTNYSALYALHYKSVSHMSSLTDCPARHIHNVSWVANQQPSITTTTSLPQGHHLGLTLYLLWLILEP